MVSSSKQNSKMAGGWWHRTEGEVSTTMVAFEGVVTVTFWAAAIAAIAIIIIITNAILVFINSIEVVVECYCGAVALPGGMNKRRRRARGQREGYRRLYSASSAGCHSTNISWRISAGFSDG
jgi:hypothetical protein